MAVSRAKQLASLLVLGYGLVWSGHAVAMDGHNPNGPQSPARRTFIKRMAGAAAAATLPTNLLTGCAGIKKRLAVIKEKLPASIRYGMESYPKDMFTNRPRRAFPVVEKHIKRLAEKGDPATCKVSLAEKFHVFKKWGKDQTFNAPRKGQKSPLGSLELENLAKPGESQTARKSFFSAAVQLAAAHPEVAAHLDTLTDLWFIESAPNDMTLPHPGKTGMRFSSTDISYWDDRLPRDVAVQSVQLFEPAYRKLEARLTKEFRKAGLGPEAVSTVLGDKHAHWGAKALELVHHMRMYVSGGFRGAGMDKKFRAEQRELPALAAIRDAFIAHETALKDPNSLLHQVINKHGLEPLKAPKGYKELMSIVLHTYPLNGASETRTVSERTRRLAIGTHKKYDVRKNGRLKNIRDVWFSVTSKSEKQPGQLVDLLTPYVKAAHWLANQVERGDADAIAYVNTPTNALVRGTPMLDPGVTANVPDAVLSNVNAMLFANFPELNTVPKSAGTLDL